MTKARSNATANAAKGDLTVGNGTNLSGVLAVGSNGDTIVADSSTSTGLRYTAGNAQGNPVLNSAMQIWQRGTSISVPAASNVTYTADRWLIGTNPSTATTVTRQTTSDTTNLPFIQYCMRIQRNSGQTGNSIVQTQSFETVNSLPFAGKTVTVSFYARKGADYSPTSNAFVSNLIWGTGTDQNVAGTYTGFTVAGSVTATLTSTWQRFSYQATISASATEIGFYNQMNTTGTAGTNDYCETTGWQIDVGSVALPFRTYAGTIQGELAACQRYYYRASNTGNGFQVFGMGIGEGGTTANINIQLPVPLRVVPTSVEYTTLALLDSATRITVTSASLITAYTSQLIANVTATVSSGLSQYRPYFLQGNNSTSAYVGFSAEL